MVDAWPIPAERLVARRYVTLLKSVVRRARPVGCDPTMVEPDFQALLNHFVRQNVDAESWLRKIENQHHYERGRADVEARLGYESAPESFRSSRPEASSAARGHQFDRQWRATAAPPHHAAQDTFSDLVPCRMHGRGGHELRSELAPTLSYEPDGRVLFASDASSGSMRMSEALAQYVRSRCGSAGQGGRALDRVADRARFRPFTCAAQSRELVSRGK